MMNYYNYHLLDVYFVLSRCASCFRHQTLHLMLTMVVQNMCCYFQFYQLKKTASGLCNFLGITQLVMVLGILKPEREYLESKH